MYDIDYRPYLQGIQNSLDLINENLVKNSGTIIDILQKPLTFSDFCVYLFLGVIVLCLLSKR